MGFPILQSKVPTFAIFAVIVVMGHEKGPVVIGDPFYSPDPYANFLLQFTISF